MKNHQKKLFFAILIKTAIGATIIFLITKTIPLIYIGLRLGLGIVLLHLSK